MDGCMHAWMDGWNEGKKGGKEGGRKSLTIFFSFFSSCLVFLLNCQGYGFILRSKTM